MNPDLLLFLLLLVASIILFMVGYRNKIRGSKTAAQNDDIQEFYKQYIIKGAYVMAVLSLVNLVQYLWL